MLVMGRIGKIRDPTWVAFGRDLSARVWPALSCKLDPTAVSDMVRARLASVGKRWKLVQGLVYKSSCYHDAVVNTLITKASCLHSDMSSMCSETNLCNQTYVF